MRVVHVQATGISFVVRRVSGFQTITRHFAALVTPFQHRNTLTGFHIFHGTLPHGLLHSASGDFHTLLGTSPQFSHLARHFAAVFTPSLHGLPLRGSNIVYIQRTQSCDSFLRGKSEGSLRLRRVSFCTVTNKTYHAQFLCVHPGRN